MKLRSRVLVGFAVVPIGIGGYAIASATSPARGPYLPQFSCATGNVLTAQGSAPVAAGSAYLVYGDGSSVSAIIRHGSYSFVLPAPGRGGQPRLLRLVDGRGRIRDVRLSRHTFTMCAGATRSVTRASESASVAAQRRELVAILGVLRRPQTKADLRATLPSPFYGRFGVPPARLARLDMQAGDPRIDWPLVRVITTSAGDEISVVPETWQPSRSSPRRAEGLLIAIHTPGNMQGVDTGPRPVSVSYFRGHGLAIFNDTRRGAVLVPDAVARVKLRGFGSVDEGGLAISIDNSRIAGRTAPVHENLAPFILAGLTASSQTFPDPFVGAVATGRMTWLDASGRVITHTSTDFGELYITVHGTKIRRRR